MKKFKTLFITCIALVMCFALLTTAYAATPQKATIDTSKTGSLTVYKYDKTEAEKANTGSYVSTGKVSSDAESALASYAIEGVEFSIVNVAEITTFTNNGNVQLLYGFDKTASAKLLSAIGLENGKDRVTEADILDSNKYFYSSDVLNKALSKALVKDEVTTTNALESYVASSSKKKAMAATSKTGKSTINKLELGLYLVVETKVPENVVDTTNPFFVSLPMTTVDGVNWNYDITVYPKNDTGDPTLEKSVREAISSTGKTEEFAQFATGSSGDIMEYEVISTLPTITSTATYLTKYDFVDTIASGLTFDKTYAVTYEIFTDAALTNKVAALESTDFSVTYTGNVMTISLTASGLEKINTYSEHTIKIVYAAKVNSDNSFIYGEQGNLNEVTLTWERTSQDFNDTLKADAIVYSFGMDLTKEFSDKTAEDAEKEKLFEKVKFVLYSETEKAYIKAELKDSIYYVTGFVSEAEATALVPQTGGKVVVMGIEDDSYSITELETADGYSLLKDKVNVAISFSEEQKASATVDGQAVTMLSDNSSANAKAVFTIVNTKIFDLPATGDSGFIYIVAIGAVVMAGAVIAVIKLSKKSEE